MKINRAISKGNAIAMGARMGHALRKAGLRNVGIVRVSPICVEGDHERLRASFTDFDAGTNRLPHMQSEEAYMDDGHGGSLWLRNCRACSSTICFHLRAEAA